MFIKSERIYSKNEDYEMEIKVVKKRNLEFGLF